MSVAGTYILGYIFSAFLPPINTEDDDFYEILGLQKNATNEQIRKAYKVKSLKLHPDKVAQRGNMNKEEAAAQYEKVQEAYGVLVSNSKRQKYHAVDCSVTRYRFIEQSSFANPQAIYENLTTASFNEKTRLVFLTLIIALLFLMQPILITEKINQTLEKENPLQNVQWTVIFIPYWIFGALGIILWCGILYFSPKDTWFSILLNILQQLSTYLSVIFLAEKWDGWSESYDNVLIPLYIAVSINWIQHVILILKLRSDVAKMVTMDFIEREVLKGKSLDDLTPEEQEFLQKDFIMITVDPEFEPVVPEGEELDEKALEEQMVESSKEYKEASEMYNSTLGAVYGMAFFGSIFLLLLTFKLNGTIGTNWWTVFTPILLYVISKILLSCYILCFGGFVVDEGLIAKTEMEAAFEVKTNEDDGDNEEKETINEPKEDKESSSKGEKEPSIKEDKDVSTAEPEKSIEEKSNEIPGMTNENPDEDVDEETFKAWQKAYIEGESAAIETQTKAFGDCCTAIFQLVMLCLVVSKIDANDEFDDDPNSVGINMYWILSPFLLMFGLIWSCCACMIYGAKSGSGSDLFEGLSDEEGDVKEEEESKFEFDSGDVEQPASAIDNDTESKVDNKIETSAPTEPADDGMEDLD